MSAMKTENELNENESLKLSSPPLNNEVKKVEEKNEESTKEIFGIESTQVVPEKTQYRSGLKLRDVWRNQYGKK